MPRGRMRMKHSACMARACVHAHPWSARRPPPRSRGTCGTPPSACPWRPALAAVPQCGCRACGARGGQRPGVGGAAGRPPTRAGDRALLRAAAVATTTAPLSRQRMPATAWGEPATPQRRSGAPPRVDRVFARAPPTPVAALRPVRCSTMQAACLCRSRGRSSGCWARATRAGDACWCCGSCAGRDVEYNCMSKISAAKLEAKTDVAHAAQGPQIILARPAARPPAAPARQGPPPGTVRVCRRQPRPPAARFERRARLRRPAQRAQRRRRCRSAA